MSDEHDTFQMDRARSFINKAKDIVDDLQGDYQVLIEKAINADDQALCDKIENAQGQLESMSDSLEDVLCGLAHFQPIR